MILKMENGRLAYKFRLAEKDTSEEEKERKYKRIQEKLRWREIISNPYSCRHDNIVRILQGKPPEPFFGYTSPIFNASLSEHDPPEHDPLFRSKWVLFVLKVRKDKKYKDLAAGKEPEQFVADTARKQMEDEIEEFRQFLSSYNLGFIPFDGQYCAKSGEHGLDLGIEVSVLVPFTDRFRDSQTILPRKILPRRLLEFMILGEDLAKMYDQDSILIQNYSGEMEWRFGLTKIRSKTKLFQYGGEFQVVTGDMVNTVLSKVGAKVGGDDSNAWNSFPEKVMEDIFSNMYTDHDFVRFCTV